MLEASIVIGRLSRERLMAAMERRRGLGTAIMSLASTLRFLRSGDIAHEAGDDADNFEASRLRANRQIRF
jgi:hypothetical protein